MDDLFGKAIAFGIILIVVSISVYAMLALTGAVNLFIGTTQEMTTKGTLFAGDGLSLDKSAIEWGLIEPNGTATAAVTITNELSGPMTLYFSTSNWVPANASVLVLSWNYKGGVCPEQGKHDRKFSIDRPAEYRGVYRFFF